MADRPDPFETLKQQQEAGVVDSPLPAAEVRARGDRMRRRRTAFRAVAAAAAVAVVTTGGVALGGSLTGGRAPVGPAEQSRRPAPSAPGPTTETSLPDSWSWVSQIPEGFPLAQGYPEDRFEETELVGPGEDVSTFQGLEVCGRLYETVADQTDRLGVRFEQPEDSRARELTLHAAPGAAHSNLSRLVELFRSCPREDVGFGGATLTQVREVEPGDEGFVFIRTYEQDGMPALGLELVYAIRVGNALLLSSSSNEGGGNEKQILGVVDEQTDVVAGIADAMCVFSRDGCSSAAEGGASEAAEDSARDAAQTASQPTFGPTGFAGIELGMSLEEANATGAQGEPFHGGDCAPLFWPEDQQSPEILGTLQRDVGIVSLSTSGPVRTPEGITLRSTLEEVRTTYPGGEWFDPTYVTPLSGHDDRQYAFTFAGGEATGILSMSLYLRTQDCIANISGTSSVP